MSQESRFPTPQTPIFDDMAGQGARGEQTNYLADYWRNQHDQIYAVLMRYAARSGRLQGAIDSAIMSLTSISNLSSNALDMREAIGDFADTERERLGVILSELEADA